MLNTNQQPIARQNTYVYWSLLFLTIIQLFGLKALAQEKERPVWQPDLGDGNYKNPIIFADYSDPDVVRVGDDFFMTASSFNAVPGLPILHSKDLVNWKIVNHAIKRFPDPYFDKVQHGNGVWAPCIRFHDGWFYIYWGDPDRGIYMVRTQDPFGDWSAPVLVKKAYGNIDASPLWDDDGNVYLVHAFANSRAGVKNLLQVINLTDSASKAGQERAVVYDGHADQPTLEGPKFYKRNGYYYIFAPAGGVSTGWQMVFRSKNVWGPYEAKKVLEQGKTDINGPHQGAWVELENGESWFIHFQDVGPYGRIAHLQPVKWVDDWPVMGEDLDGNGIGEPVATYKKPEMAAKSSMVVPQTSDEFNTDTLGLQWQWHGNDYPDWYKLTGQQLQLQAQPYPALPRTLWQVPNLLLQKFPAPEFTTTTKVDLHSLKDGERTGLLIMGLDYAAVQVTKRGDQMELSLTECHDAIDLKSEEIMASQKLESTSLFLKVQVSEGAKCQFAYSTDGQDYTPIGETFQAKEGRWIGAKVGLFAVTVQEAGLHGHASYDWFRVTPAQEMSSTGQ